MDIVNELLSGNKRALAKAISLVENEAPNKKEAMSQLYPHTGKAFVIGITGSPGAGKSSLVDKLTNYARKMGLTVGIIAVDPTSPFSGGALLGDRIRMQDHALDEGVFIRSMGTRGSLGGLARATKEAIKVLDAYGKDLVLVETVGVGQSELDIMNAADTTVVVLTPGAGDVIQTMKAGIMEIADVFVVNKADRDGAQKLVTDVESMLDLAGHREWRPPVVQTIALTEKGIDDLYAAISRHKSFLENEKKLETLRKCRLRLEVVDMVVEEVKNRINKQFQGSQELEKLLERVMEKEIDPYSAAGQILDMVFKK
ncbi:MAG: methylmalonyl Co-A mutase-associated GTPase MeaB [Bacillota bacterium]